MRTYEFTLVPTPPNSEELVVVPVTDDGLCDLPGIATADPNKTFIDIVAGDFLLVSGERKKVKKVVRLE